MDEEFVGGGGAGGVGYVEAGSAPIAKTHADYPGWVCSRLFVGDDAAIGRRQLVVDKTNKASCEAAGGSHAWQKAMGDLTHDRVVSKRKTCSFPCEYEDDCYDAQAAKIDIMDITNKAKSFAWPCLTAGPPATGYRNTCGTQVDFWLADRECKAAKACAVGTEWATSPPGSATSVDTEGGLRSRGTIGGTDRQCAPLTVCDAGLQYQTTAPLKATIKQLNAANVCTDGEMINTKNRVCTCATKCEAVSAQTVAVHTGAPQAEGSRGFLTPLSILLPPSIQF
jgi:hypothetical protein